MGSPGCSVIKNLSVNAGDARHANCIPGSGRSPGRKWQPTQVVLPGESHGQRSLMGYSWWSRRESDMAEATQFALMCFSLLSYGPKWTKFPITFLIQVAQNLLSGFPTTISLTSCSLCPQPFFCYCNSTNVSFLLTMRFKEVSHVTF